MDKAAELAHWAKVEATHKIYEVPRWEYRGVSGECRSGKDGKSPPRHIGKYSGELVVIGTAPCVFDDLAKLPKHYDRMAIGSIGNHIPNLTHWACLHCEAITLQAHLRLIDGFFPTETKKPIIHTHHFKRRKTLQILADRHIDTYWHTGTMGYPLSDSGLFGVTLGIAMGYDEIICAGIPLDGQGSFFGKYTMSLMTEEYMQERYDCWKNYADLPEFKKRVRSVSGYTKELLGLPKCLLQKQLG
jgi:hypothetical protein